MSKNPILNALFAQKEFFAGSAQRVEETLRKKREALATTQTTLDKLVKDGDSEKLKAYLKELHPDWSEEDLDSAVIELLDKQAEKEGEDIPADARRKELEGMFMDYTLAEIGTAFAKQDIGRMETAIAERDLSDSEREARRDFPAWVKKHSIAGGNVAYLDNKGRYK